MPRHTTTNRKDIRVRGSGGGYRGCDWYLRNGHCLLLMKVEDRLIKSVATRGRKVSSHNHHRWSSILGLNDGKKGMGCDRLTDRELYCKR